MKILLTGANGYIGMRLLPLLIQEGHFVYCSVRDRARFHIPKSWLEFVEVVEVDFLKPETFAHLPSDIDAAYYLMHSMAYENKFVEVEHAVASNFNRAMKGRGAKQVLYLSGIVNDANLSKHLLSRQGVEEVLSSGPFALTTLKAGIIIGSGSASFEIMRDLVEKLPFMITPKWVLTKSQPIAVRDVLSFLIRSLNKPELYHQSFDIGGPDVLTYKDMMLGLAKHRGLKRKILVVPVMTPRLSSYWLYFVTSTTYSLAVALVNSMKVEVVCTENNLANFLAIKALNYQEALSKTFLKIDQNEVVSSWKDAAISSVRQLNISDFIYVPTHGCFTDKRMMTTANNARALDRIWSIGGKTGWYYGTWLWKIRGLIDKLNGGVGLRRGRTHPFKIEAGDSIDFWRVIYANKDEGRLLLYAEMRLPGDAWLEFKVQNSRVLQTATFRPKGLAGRMYWFSVWPFHGFIFKGMLKKLVA